MKDHKLCFSSLLIDSVWNTHQFVQTLLANSCWKDRLNVMTASEVRGYVTNKQIKNTQQFQNWHSYVFHSTDNTYNSQGIILNFQVFLFRCHRLWQICPTWVFPFILNHNIPGNLKINISQNMNRLHHSFFQSDSFLSLPVLERWICSGWGSLPFEKCREISNKNQTIFCIFDAIPQASQTHDSRNRSNIMETLGAFHSTKNSGNSGMGSEWNSHFPEFHSEILGVPREVGLKIPFHSTIPARA